MPTPYKITLEYDDPLAQKEFDERINNYSGNHRDDEWRALTHF